MNEAQYFMGIDTGTQSVRVAVADINGNIIASNEQTWETYYPKPGWAEQKPDEWLAALDRALTNVTDNLSMGVRYAIKAVSVCSTSSTVLPVDEEGHALDDAIMWMDTRAVEQMTRINATKHPVLDFSGGEDSVEWMLPKTLWIRDNKPEVYQNAYKIVEQLDFINYLLAGKFSTSICQAACKWNYVSSEDGWNEDFFEQIGFPEYKQKLVTEVTAPGTVLGTVRRDFAEKYDLNPDMLVVQGGIDAHIGMIGLGVARPGKLAMIMGTSFVQLAFADKRIALDGIWGPYDEPILPGKWLLEGGQISAGSIIKWYMKAFGLSGEDNPYALMAEEIKNIPPGANGLVALDFFQGNRTPYKDPNAKGVIYGLTLSHTRGDIYKALLESVALGTKNIIDNFEKQGAPIDMVVGSGGVTKDKAWMQIIADATGKPIVVTADSSSGALGCTIVAAVGTGAYPDMDSATRGMVKDAYIIEPNPAVYEDYQKVFNTYETLYGSLKDLMAKA